jgi:hypothetical protein
VANDHALKPRRDVTSPAVCNRPASESKATLTRTLKPSESNSFRFSRRFGRKAVLTGICGMLAGQALMLLVLRLSGPQPGVWSLTGPLLLAGLGNGLVIAPNQESGQGDAREPGLLEAARERIRRHADAA